MYVLDESHNAFKLNLVTSLQPFDKYNNATDDEIIEKLKSIALGERDVSIIFDERTAGLSSSVLSLLRRMLDPNPEKRITAEQFRRN